eukprot:4344860-Alexandrium_andersonii.AAC.1
MDAAGSAGAQPAPLSREASRRVAAQRGRGLKRSGASLELSLDDESCQLPGPDSMSQMLQWPWETFQALEPCE